jgi:signal transduction histidine kinase
MQEVFANVINNAIRYTPRGGQVLLSAQQLEREIEFRIHDTGPGLEPAELDRIFERFHRVQGARTREEGGSGLGLAIARSIVDKHQGRIWAESPPGAGLTIVVRLPISPPEDA